MTGFQQDFPKPQGIRGFISVGAARASAALILEGKPFVILSHPKWQEFAWVAPPEYAIPKALMGGIAIVEMAQ